MEEESVDHSSSEEQRNITSNELKTDIDKQTTENNFMDVFTEERGQLHLYKSRYDQVSYHLKNKELELIDLKIELSKVEGQYEHEIIQMRDQLDDYEDKIYELDEEIIQYKTEIKSINSAYTHLKEELYNIKADPHLEVKIKWVSKIIVIIDTIYRGLQTFKNQARNNKNMGFIRSLNLILDQICTEIEIELDIPQEGEKLDLEKHLPVSSENSELPKDSIKRTHRIGIKYNNQILRKPEVVISNGLAIKKEKSWKTKIFLNRIK